jgi:hypothetical protein
MCGLDASQPAVGLTSLQVALALGTEERGEPWNARKTDCDGQTEGTCFPNERAAAPAAYEARRRMIQLLPVFGIRRS